MSPAAVLSLVAVAVASYTPVLAVDLGVRTCETLSHALSHSSQVFWPAVGLDVGTCDATSCATSPSQVFWPGSLEYDNANSHPANSSSEISTCAVEPSTVKELSTIIEILGSTRTPFGIKSGGHTANPGFSSTTGVQISLARFSEVKYDQDTSTVRVGSGLLWDDVYAALEPHGVIVVGGRVSGVGVGGFATGGGYSWKSNQHGLTVDTITAFDLVLPNGTFIVVTQSSYPDLFFGLKGGFNNFGIVTSFTFRAFPQSQVWGGSILYSGEQFEAISKATANFSANNRDPKASLITTYVFLQEYPVINLFLFYDAPDVGNGVFDEFLAVESLSQDVSTRSYLSLVKSFTAGGNVGSVRTAFHTVSLLSFSKNILDVIANETTSWGTQLQLAPGAFISYAVEPFHGVSTHATSSAFPHDAPLLPLQFGFYWPNATLDHTFISAIKSSVQRVYEEALAEGQDISIENGKQIRYPNYALWDTPLEEMYGENIHTLKRLRALYDPQDIMSLTGGFRF